MNNDFSFWFWLGVIADFAQLESYEMLLKDSHNNDIMLKLDEILKILKEGNSNEWNEYWL